MKNKNIMKVKQANEIIKYVTLHSLTKLIERDRKRREQTWHD